MNWEQRLPASLQGQLRAVRRWLWCVETAVLVLGGVCGLVGAYGLLFVSDRLWDSPVWLRLALGWMAVGVCVGFVAWWVGGRTWRRRDARRVAVLVQRAFPRLGDRLLGVIELADPARRPPNVSERLCQAALEQVAAEAMSLDFRRAVPTQRVRWLAVVAGAMVAGAMGVSVMLPAVARNVWQRLAWPLAGIERFTLTQVAGLPARQVVAFGEPFEVTFRLSDASYWRPRRAVVSWEGRQAVEVVADSSGRFRVSWPGVTRSGQLQVAVGDARAAVPVVALHRPELVELAAVVQGPDYLGAETVTQDVRTGKVRVLEGSVVEVSGRLNRRVSEVRSEQGEVAHEGDRFGWRWGPVAEPQRREVTWEDEYGLRGREALVVELQPVADEAPVVEVRGLRDGMAILEDEVLTFSVVARDDFGVKEADWKWYAAGDEQLGLLPTNGTVRAGVGEPRQRELVGSARFAPAALGLGPQLVVVQARALDYRPGREHAVSPPYRVLIVDRLEHARWVQREAEQLQEKLEELARLEEALWERNRELRERLEDAAARGELASARRAEEENIERMMELAERARELLQEALRNPLVVEEVLRRWAQLAERLAGIAGQPMTAAAQALQQAGQTEGQERAQQMEQALAAQQAALSEMMEALREANRTQDQLTAGNFVARLRAAARLQYNVAGELTRLMPETIGLRPEQLPASQKLRLNRLAEMQRRNQKAVRYVRDDLAGFATRAREERAGRLAEEMSQVRVVEELEKLSQQIEANVGGQAIEQANRWAGRLEAWAEQLAPSAAGGAGGAGGGGGAEISPEMLALVLKLTRARLVEEGLRDNTRVLDEMKDRQEPYGQAVQRLAQMQGALAEDVEQLLEPTLPPELLRLLGRVVDAMMDATELLRRPETGAETVAAQTEVIELLSESSRQAAGSAAGGGATAMWMQMLGGTASGGNGGGNPGRRSFEEDGGQEGGRAGGAVDPRKVERATGRDWSRYPAEFREVLERYFEAVEGVEP